MPLENCVVLIVGGGPAGLAAGLELRRLGIDNVVVLERETEAGGAPRFCQHTGFGLRDLRRLKSGPAYAHAYRSRAAAAGVEIRTSTTVTGWAGPRTVCVTSPAGRSEIEAAALLLATGCRERPHPARLVAGNRPQGVFTAGSLQRFVYGHGQRVGRRAVVVGAELVSLSAVLTLAHAGTAVAMMITEHPQHQVYLPYAPVLWYARKELGVQVVARSRVDRILGHRRVEAVELTHLDTGQTEVTACDTVVFTGSWIPEHELARLGDLALDQATRGPQIDPGLRTSTEGIFAAGNLLRGAETASHAALEGRHAAVEIARYLDEGLWPRRSLPIQVQKPIAWVSPNSLSAAHEAPPLGRFLWQVDSFCGSGRIGVYQGNRLLYSQRFRHLAPNRTYALGRQWLDAVDMDGDAVRVQLILDTGNTSPQDDAYELSLHR